MASKHARALMTTALLATALALSGCPDDHGGHADHADPTPKDPPAANDADGGHVQLKLEAKQIELAGIKTAAASLDTIGVDAQLTGEVALNEDQLAHLVARVPGVVRRVYATLGANVQEGELMAELESFGLGEAKASFLEKRQQLELAEADLARVKTVHENTVKMLAFLEGFPSSDELKTLEGLDLGENRSSLISAYSELLFARAKHTREKDLFAKKISSENELIEAETEHKKAEASLTAIRDQLTFSVRRSLLAQQRSHRVAQLSLRTARRKLLLLGVTEGELRCEPCGVDFPLDVRDETNCEPCLQARAALPEGGKAGATLSRYALKAPFAGTVIEKHLTLGEQVDGETNLYSLSNLGTVWVIASVYERDIARVKVGQTATISVKAYPDRTFGGAVTWVADVMEEETRTLKIRMLIENPDRLLKKGMFARVALRVETREGALIVPPSAIQTQKGVSIVFVEEGGGTFERREVEVGVRSSTAVEVLSGVEAGEAVVTEGSFILKAELEKEGFHAGHAH